MPVRGDLAGVGSVVLGILMLAAGVPLLVPSWVLSEEPERPVPAPRPAAPAVASAPSVEKEPGAPRLQVEHAKGAEGVVVEVARARAEPGPLARFAERALVPLTPDEEALLREEAVDDVAALVARTERAFREATPQTRAEKERRYLASLNLAAKLASPPEPSAAEARAREVDARYQKALAEEQVKWRGLTPEARAREHEAFKEWFFRREETR